MNDTIETRDYWIVNEYLIFKHKFNDSLDKYANLLNKYTSLIFSNYDDWKICIETNNEYIFKYHIQYVSSKFNQPIKLNQNLTHLTMGKRFNQPIQLTNEIKYLYLCSNPYNLIDNLPHGIEELVLDWYFNSPMNDLPTSIKIIKLNCIKYEHELNCLPISVEYLKLNSNYNKKIVNIPKGLKKICCSKSYLFIDDFYHLSNCVVKHC